MSRSTRVRPPFDPVALVVGVVAVVIAVLGLLGPDVAARVDLGVLWASALLAAGAALLLSAVVRSGRSGRSSRAGTGSDDTPPSAPQGGAADAPQEGRDAG